VSTVRQVVDAVFRDWLRAPDDAPVVALLDTALSASATTVAFDTSMLTPDELDLFAKGTIVEVGREQMLLLDDASTLVVRGWNGTTAVAHGAGTPVYPQPKFSRQTVYDAVCDAVPALYPDLYQVGARTVVAGSSYTELPSYAHHLQQVLWVDGATTRTLSGEAFLARDYAASSTGVAMFAPIPANKTAYVTFRGGFRRPEGESDDLELLGVARHWERAIVIEAAAQVVAGTAELDPLTHEFIAEQLARETMPVGGAGQLAKRLADMAAATRMRLRRELDALYGVPVVWMPSVV
jgi:hypothetical protein